MGIADDYFACYFCKKAMGMKRILIKSIYNTLGAISIGNGLWMLLSASTWFSTMPVDAEDTGPLNPHFIHDVGLIYLLVGLGAFWCGHKPKNSFEVHLGITLFMAGHAIIHIIEILSGALPSSHWIVDFPLITLPAIFLVTLTPSATKSTS